MDALQHLDVLLERVGVEGGHDAAGPEIADADHGCARAQGAPLPAPFLETGNAADDDVRSQPAAIVSEGRDGPVGGDQEREDVESFHASRPDEPGTGPRGRLDGPSDPGVCPGPVLDEWLAVGAELDMQAEELRPRP